MAWFKSNGVAMNEFEVMDMKAGQSLQGIPPGEMADKMEAYEKQLDDWVKGAGPFRSLLRVFCCGVLLGLLKIHRTEIFELAVGYAKQMNDKRAAVMQENDYRQFMSMVEQNRSLRSFLFEHFNGDLSNADALNTPLPEVVKNILLRYKFGSTRGAPERDHVPTIPPGGQN
jgi:hypothetical protein